MLVLTHLLLATVQLGLAPAPLAPFGRAAVTTAPAPGPAPPQPIPSPSPPDRGTTPGVPPPVPEQPRTGPAPTTPHPSPAPTPTPTPADPSTGAPEVFGTPEAVFEPPELPMRGLSPDYLPPFDSDEMALSDVLNAAMGHNIDLATNAIDIEISEQQVKAALGAWDVFLVGGINASANETPRRGSQIVFVTGQRSIGGNVGIRRRIETGGQIDVSLVADRIKQQQLNFNNLNAPPIDLSTYQIRANLTFTHPLLKGAGLKVNRADYDRAKIAVSQAQATRQFTAQNAVRDIVARYWDLLFAHRNLENKRRSVEVAKRQLERTQALVAAGRVSPVDAKAVEQSLAVREGDVINAENALLNASLDLRTIMGEDFSQASVYGVLPTTDPVVKPRAVDTKGEVARALAANPQVRQLQLAIASRRIDELVAANQKLPQLDVTGSFSPQGRATDTLPSAATGNPGQQVGWSEAFRNIFNDNVLGDGLLADWTVSGAISLTWDIQNRTPKANYEIARLQIERAETQLALTRQQLAGSVIRAANAVRTAAKVMEVAEVSLDLAKENLQAEQARFDVGRSTNFDVLMRLDEVDAAEGSALSAQVAYLKALNELQALNGELLPAYGMDVR